MIITNSAFKRNVAIPGLAIRPYQYIYGNETLNAYYIPILKNAHTWGVEFFQENYNFKKLDELTLFNAPSDTSIIVFLRDPIERWYSGIAQYFYMNMGLDTNKDYILEDNMIKLVFSAVSLDGHTDLQVNSVLGLNTNNCVFFNIDDKKHFDFKFRNFLAHRKIGFVKKNIPPNNTSESNLFKKSIIDQLKFAAEKDPSLLWSVRRHYEQDLQFFGFLKHYMIMK